jgi:hypothetical protein
MAEDDSQLLHRDTRFLPTILYGLLTQHLIELLIPFDSALIAQLVERVTSNDEVAGSTPS